MADLKNKVILTVAPTGAWPSKKDIPNIPIEPSEIADDVYKCWKAGASVAHIHVRGDDGKASMSFDKFNEAVTKIRATDADIVLNLTTSGGIGIADEVRMKPYEELRPEIASFDCGSMNWSRSCVFENSPSFLTKLGTSMQECKVTPEIEIFDAGMIYNALYYMKKGVLKGPGHFQICLDVPGGIGASVANLVFLKSLLPEGATWSAFGVGKSHIEILYAAIAMGGHVRVGMEDNIFYSKGVLVKDNVQFIERAKRLIKEANKEVATPAETREILGLVKQK